MVCQHHVIDNQRYSTICILKPCLALKASRWGIGDGASIPSCSPSTHLMAHRAALQVQHSVRLFVSLEQASHVIVRVLRTQEHTVEVLKPWRHQQHVRTSPWLPAAHGRPRLDANAMLDALMLCCDTAGNARQHFAASDRLLGSLIMVLQGLYRQGLNNAGSP